MGYFLNRASLIGNITKKPELTYTPSGTPIAKFSLATNRRVKKGDDWDTIGTFHNIVVFGKTAEWVAKNFSKGDKVYVEGRIENRTWDKPDGTRGYISEIIAEELVPQVKPKKTEPGEHDEEADTTQDNINLDDIDFDIEGGPEKTPEEPF